MYLKILTMKLLPISLLFREIQKGKKFLLNMSDEYKQFLRTGFPQPYGDELAGGTAIYVYSDDRYLQSTQY